MKKIFITLAFLLAACNNSENLKVGTYKMVNSPNNVPITVSFSDDGNLNAKVVNIIMGEYKAKNGSITITPKGATMMMGPQNEMDAEQKFIQTLPSIKRYKMQGNKLFLILDDGKELILESYVETKE